MKHEVKMFIGSLIAISSLTSFAGGGGGTARPDDELMGYGLKCVSAEASDDLVYFSVCKTPFLTPANIPNNATCDVRNLNDPINGLGNASVFQVQNDPKYQKLTRDLGFAVIQDNDKAVSMGPDSESLVVQYVYSLIQKERQEQIDVRELVQMKNQNRLSVNSPVQAPRISIELLKNNSSTLYNCTVLEKALHFTAKGRNNTKWYLDMN